MLKENHDLGGALKAYIQLLYNESYFYAHEVLEEAWHPLRKSKHPLSNLVKGLINAAIAFEHLKRNREDAHRKAQTVIASYERHKSLAVKGIIYYELFMEATKQIEALKTTNLLFR
ncbi:MAG: DUF309 domain-containing protein [Epsilonproteobacteria bacterium]|nr:DUF309 domain-containing protein [Campylobacterota bacterium]